MSIGNDRKEGAALAGSKAGLAMLPILDCDNHRENHVANSVIIIERTMLPMVDCANHRENHVVDCQHQNSSDIREVKLEQFQLQKAESGTVPLPAMTKRNGSGRNLV